MSVIVRHMASTMPRRRLYLRNHGHRCVATCTQCVPQSPSTIICYRSQRSEAPRLRRYNCRRGVGLATCPTVTDISLSAERPRVEPATIREADSVVKSIKNETVQCRSTLLSQSVAIHRVPARFDWSIIG